MKSRPISVTPFPLQNLTSKPGCYSLIIDLQRGKKIRVGKLGVGFFPRGIYVYTGSAMNGLGARLRRHVTRKKKRHWHIDYLLASPEARIEKILCYPPAPGQECRQNQRIAALAGASVMLRRFGASDCNAGCASHLFYFANDAGANLAVHSNLCFRHVVGGRHGRPNRRKRTSSAQPLYPHFISLPAYRSCANHRADLNFVVRDGPIREGYL